MKEIFLISLGIIFFLYIFREFFPKEGEIIKTNPFSLNRKMNLFWLIAFFVFFSLLSLFLYFFAREIQKSILKTSQKEFYDILVINSLPFFLPIMFFSSGAIVLFFDIFFGKEFIFSRLQRIGKDKRKKYYLALWGWLNFVEDPGNPKEIEKLEKRMEKYRWIILVFGFLFIIPVILSIDWWVKIDQNGVYHNPWFSLGKEKFYSWDKIESIYLIKGRILKTGEYEEAFEYEIKTSDGKSFLFNRNFSPKNHSFEKIANFISRKTQKRIECKIKDLKTKKYLDCSEKF